MSGERETGGGDAPPPLGAGGPVAAPAPALRGSVDTASHGPSAPGIEDVSMQQPEDTGDETEDEGRGDGRMEMDVDVDDQPPAHRIVHAPGPTPALPHPRRPSTGPALNDIPLPGVWDSPPQGPSAGLNAAALAQRGAPGVAHLDQAQSNARQTPLHAEHPAANPNVRATPPAPVRRTSPPGSGPSEEAAALLLNFSAVGEHPLPSIAEHPPLVVTAPTPQAPAPPPPQPQPVTNYPHTPPADSPNSTIRSVAFPAQSASSPSGLPTPSAPSPEAPTKSTKQKRKRNAVAGPSRHSSASADDPSTSERPLHWMGADNTVIRCICGLTEDDGFTVLCERCNAWEHALCFGFRDDALLPEVFLCELCNPRPLPFTSDMARNLQIQQRASFRTVKPVQEVVEQKKSRPKTKRPRTEGVRRDPEQSEPAAASSDQQEPKDASGMAPPSSTKPKRRSQPGKPRSKTAESGYAASLVSGQEEDDYFRVMPWELEYTPLKDNVIRSRQTRQAMTQLYHEWVDEDDNVASRKSRPIYHNSGLPSPTNTGLRLSPEPETLTSPPDFSPLGPPVPPVFLNGSDLSSIEAATALRPIEESACYLPLKYIEPSSGVYPRPTIYGVFMVDQIAAGGFVGEYRGEVLDASSYRKDPINQYSALGVPKPYVHSIGPPINLLVDARSYGNEMRFVRNGCHPNAVLRPLFFRAEDSSCTKLRFGIFASRDLAKNEEVVLGWDWDDQHVVHTLRAIIDSTLKSAANKPAIAPETVELLTTKFDSILTNIFGTFQSCACTVTTDCAFSQMRRLVSGMAFHGVSGQRARKRIDLGELIGAVRGWRRRELEEAAAAKARRFRSSGEWEVWRAGPGEGQSRPQSEHQGSEEEDEDEDDEQEDELDRKQTPEVVDIKVPLQQPEEEVEAKAADEYSVPSVAEPIVEPAVEQVPEKTAEPAAEPALDAVDPDETDEEEVPPSAVMDIDEPLSPAATPKAVLEDPEPPVQKSKPVPPAATVVKPEPEANESEDTAAAPDGDVVMKEPTPPPTTALAPSSSALSLAPSSSVLSIDLPPNDIPTPTAAAVEEEGEEELASGHESDATTITIARSNSANESEPESEAEVRPAARRGRRVLSPAAGESASRGATTAPPPPPPVVEEKQEKLDKDKENKPEKEKEKEKPKPAARARLVPSGRVVTKTTRVSMDTAAVKRPRPRKNVIASSDEDASDEDEAERSPVRAAKKAAPVTSKKRKAAVAIASSDEEADSDAEKSEAPKPPPRKVERKESKESARDRDRERAEKTGSISKLDKRDKHDSKDKHERHDKASSSSKRDKAERPEKSSKHESSGKHDKRSSGKDKEKIEKHDGDKSDKVADKLSKVDKDKVKVKLEKVDKADKAESSKADPKPETPRPTADDAPKPVPEPVVEPAATKEKTPEPSPAPKEATPALAPKEASPERAPAPVAAKEPTPPPKEATPPPKEPTPAPKEATPPPAKEPTPPPPPPPPKKVSMKEYLASHKIRKVSHSAPSEPVVDSPVDMAKEAPPAPAPELPLPVVKVEAKAAQPVSTPTAVPTQPSRLNLGDFLPSARSGSATGTPLGTPFTPTAPSPMTERPGSSAGPASATPTTTTSSAYVPRSAPDYFGRDSASTSSGPSSSFVPRPSPSYVPRTLSDESPSAGTAPHPSPSYLPRQPDMDMAVSPLAVRPPLPAQTPPRPTLGLPDIPPAIGARDGPPHHLYGPRAPPTGPRMPPTGPRNSWGGGPGGPVTGANAAGGPVSPLAPLRGGGGYGGRGGGGPGGFGGSSRGGGFGDRGAWRGRGGFRGRGRGGM